MDLLLGINPLTVRAVNDGGEGRAGVVVTRVEEPVRVLIETVKAAGGIGQVLNPKLLPDGRPEFNAALQAGVARIAGRVKWQPGTKPGDQAQAHVYVNGFQQIPVDLVPADDGSTDKTFKADVILNEEANDIVVEVPELKQDAGTRQGFTLPCTAPVKKQRWHVLVVGVGKQKPEEVRKDVLKHLRAKAEGDEHFRRAGVEEGTLYGPLTGADATPDKIYTQLLLMKSQIEQTAGNKEADDVVMVYYQGAEEIKSDGHFFLTSLSGQDSDPKRDALSCDELRRQLDDTLGAEVLLLDVAASRTASKSLDRVAGWRKGQHVGVVRYSWRGTVGRPADLGVLTGLDEAVTLGDLRSLVKGAAEYKDYLFLDYYLPRQLAGFVVNPRQSKGSP
jgi:hypothetical protein